MNYFRYETNLSDPLTSGVMEVASLVMRRVRSELRRREGGTLSFTETRAMVYVTRLPGSSVGDVAEFLGIGVPTTSKVIDQLAQRGYLERVPAEADRRRLELGVTEAGVAVLRETLEPAYAAIAGMLAPLSGEERTVVEKAMAILHPLLGPGERVDDE